MHVLGELRQIDFQSDLHRSVYGMLAEGCREVECIEEETSDEEVEQYFKVFMSAEGITSGRSYLKYVLQEHIEQVDFGFISRCTKDGVECYYGYVFLEPQDRSE